MSYRYGKGIVQLKGPVIYYQYTFTNIVPRCRTDMEKELCN